jgi:hypothetical protein
VSTRIHDLSYDHPTIQRHIDYAGRTGLPRDLVWITRDSDVVSPMESVFHSSEEAERIALLTFQGIIDVILYLQRIHNAKGNRTEPEEDSHEWRFIEVFSPASNFGYLSRPNSAGFNSITGKPVALTIRLWEQLSELWKRKGTNEDVMLDIADPLDPVLSTAQRETAAAEGETSPNADGPPPYSPGHSPPGLNSHDQSPEPRACSPAVVAHAHFGIADPEQPIALTHTGEPILSDAFEDIISYVHNTAVCLTVERLNPLINAANDEIDDLEEERNNLRVYLDLAIGKEHHLQQLVDEFSETCADLREQLISVRSHGTGTRPSSPPPPTQPDTPNPSRIDEDDLYDSPSRRPVSAARLIERATSRLAASRFAPYHRD